MSEPPHDSSGVGIRARLTLALIGVAILPIVALVVVVLVLERAFDGPVVEAPAGPILLFAFAVIIALAILASFALSGGLLAPLRSVASALDRVSAGDLTTPIQVSGDDELARLADSHNRLAADLLRRNRELRRILAAI